MRRELFVTIGVVSLLLTGTVQGQGAFEIRAAATRPVSGWQQMPAPDDTLWIAPTKALTAADIERAAPATSSDGAPAVSVVFTDEGAKRIAELTTARRGAPIAFLLDGKVIWAPTVRDGIQKEALLTGGPGGLSADEIQRLLAALKQR